MADVATPGQDLIAAAAGDCSAAQDAAPAQQEDEVVDESDAKLPAPLNNGAYRKILKELPDGPRIAAETCVQFWKVCSCAPPRARAGCVHGRRRAAAKVRKRDGLGCCGRICSLAGQEVSDRGACGLSQDYFRAQVRV